MIHDTTNPSQSQENISYYAPSEKHLEDWIVSHLDEFKEQTGLQLRRLVARQPEFPSGRPDLIVSILGSVAAVELKKDKADGRAIAQVLRYMGDMRMIHDYNNEGRWSHSRNGGDPSFGYARPIIHGVVVAAGFDNNAYLAGVAHNIDMFEYDYDGTNYTFTAAWNECGGSWQSLIGTDVESAINEVIRHQNLYDKDRDTLKEIYRSEGWIK